MDEDQQDQQHPDSVNEQETDTEQVKSEEGLETAKMKDEVKTEDDPPTTQTAVKSQPQKEEIKELEQKTAKLEERIKANEWDVEAWIGLMNEAQQKHIDISRPIFERFVKQFPTAVIISFHFLNSIEPFLSNKRKGKILENLLRSRSTSWIYGKCGEDI